MFGLLTENGGKVRLDYVGGATNITLHEAVCCSEWKWDFKLFNLCDVFSEKEMIHPVDKVTESRPGEGKAFIWLASEQANRLPQRRYRSTFSASRYKVKVTQTLRRFI